MTMPLLSTEVDATLPSLVMAEYEGVTPSAALNRALPMTSIVSPGVNIMSSPAPSFFAAKTAASTSSCVFAQTSLAVLSWMVSVATPPRESFSVPFFASSPETMASSTSISMSSISSSASAMTSTSSFSPP